MTPNYKHPIPVIFVCTDARNSAITPKQAFVITRNVL